MLLPALDLSNELQELALIELTNLSSKIFKMRYEIGCIFQVKDGYNTNIDLEIQANSNYYNATDEFRFFYFKSIAWHGTKLKYLLHEYFKTIYDNEFLFVKVNLEESTNSMYIIDTLEVKGTWVDNPVGLKSRYRILYDLMTNPNISGLDVHCNICGITINYHDFQMAHSTNLHCPHHHHLIYDSVADIVENNLAI
jgi:hypothetical protein